MPNGEVFLYEDVTSPTSSDDKNANLFGDLADVFKLGNMIRVEHNLPPRDQADWLRTQEARAYIAHVSELIGRPATHRKPGRGSKLKANVYVMLEAARNMHPDIKLFIYTAVFDVMQEV
jgi:hypothetical protein